MKSVFILVASAIAAVSAQELVGSNGQFQKYCKESSPTFQERNQAHYRGVGNWTNVGEIYININPNNDGDLTDLIQLPYWSQNTYDEDNCQFLFTQFWFSDCNSVTCPLLPAGLYGGIQQSGIELEMPNGNCQHCEQHYFQNFPTPNVPGLPDQTAWHSVHTGASDRHALGLYFDPTTMETLYEELISIDIPNVHREYSAQQYMPSTLHPGLRKMIWVLIESYQTGTFVEPIQSTFDRFHNGTLPLVEYAPGMFAHITMISPAASTSDSTVLASNAPDMFKNASKNASKMRGKGLKVGPKF